MLQVGYPGCEGHPSCSTEASKDIYWAAIIQKYAENGLFT